MEQANGVRTRELAEGISTSTVFDAHGKTGALPPSLTRRHGSGVMAGPAVTAACDEGSIMAGLAALETAAPGSVLVLQGAGDWAYLGELIASEATRAGLVGIVIDGFARDIAEVRTLPIALFARGLTPQGAGFGTPGRSGVELVVGGTRIRPGDWIFGDEDGVTVVPADRVEQVTAAAAQIARSEAELAASVLAGRTLLDHITDDGRVVRDLLHPAQPAEGHPQNGARA